METSRAIGDRAIETIASFVKAVSRVAVGGVDCDFVASILQTHSCVDDQTLSTANSQVWVDEEDPLWRLCSRLWGQRGHGNVSSLCFEFVFRVSSFEY